MESSDEKFFEELAAQGAVNADHQPEVKVELTKAKSAVASRANIQTPKKRIERSEIDDPDDMEHETEGQLTIDVYQTPSEIIVESAIAGVAPDDLDINVTNDSITIRGKRHHEQEVSDDDYFYQECYWGRFSRSVILPQEIDAEKAYANFKNSILTIHLPKLNRKTSKKVKVRLE